MVLTLASDEVSVTVTWPSPSRSISSTSLSPPCHSGALSTSSTTAHTCSIGASISAVEDPLIVPIGSLLQLVGAASLPRPAPSRADEVIAVLHQVADHVVARVVVERDRHPVALVEVVARDDRVVGLAQRLGQDRVALDADVERLAVQSRQGEHLSRDLEHRDAGREREVLDGAGHRQAPLAQLVRRHAPTVPTWPSARDRPGASSSTRTSGARCWTCARDACGGLGSAERRRRARPRGKKVRQWIGTAVRGRSSAVASAAWGGSMWPGPSVGPQPQIGRRARSSPGARSAIPGKISVSPAEHTRRPPVPSRDPSGSAKAPRGWRWPSCWAGTAATSTAPTVVVSPGASSVISEKPARETIFPAPRGTT